MQHFRVVLPVDFYITIHAKDEAHARAQAEELAARLGNWEDLGSLDRVGREYNDDYGKDDPTRLVTLRIDGNFHMAVNRTVGDIRIADVSPIEEGA